DLQVRHVAIEIDPVQALQVQVHMPVENVRRRHRSLRHHAPPTASMTPSKATSHSPTQVKRPTQPPTSAVRGGASLGAPPPRLVPASAGPGWSYLTPGPSR